MKFASSLSDLPLDLDFSPDIIEQVQKDETDLAEARFSRLRNTYEETCACLYITSVFCLIFSCRGSQDHVGASRCGRDVGKHRLLHL